MSHTEVVSSFVSVTVDQTLADIPVNSATEDDVLQDQKSVPSATAPAAERAAGDEKENEPVAITATVSITIQNVAVDEESDESSEWDDDDFIPKGSAYGPVSSVNKGPQAKVQKDRVASKEVDGAASTSEGAKKDDEKPQDGKKPKDDKKRKDDKKPKDKKDSKKNTKVTNSN